MVPPGVAGLPGCCRGAAGVLPGCCRVAGYLPEWSGAKRSGAEWSGVKRMKRSEGDEAERSRRDRKDFYAPNLSALSDLSIYVFVC